MHRNNLLPSTGATKWATKETKITIKVTGNVTLYHKERENDTWHWITLQLSILYILRMITETIKEWKARITVTDINFQPDMNCWKVEISFVELFHGFFQALDISTDNFRCFFPILIEVQCRLHTMNCFSLYGWTMYK